MWQFILILLVIAAAVVALKVALILIFLLGLIFRTKETLGLLLVLGIMAIFRNYTAACLVFGVIAGVAALMNYAKKQRESDTLPKLTDRTGD